MATRQLPIFVYGTLRPGERNYTYFLEGKTTAEHAAFLLHYEMYDGAYPYILSTKKNGKIRGNLLSVRSDAYRKVLQSLDALEGFDSSDRAHSEYIRVMKKVVCICPNHRLVPTWAWIYHANRSLLGDLAGRRIIPSGDWLSGHQRGY